MNVLEHVAENVRKHRLAAALSQEALAKKSGVSRRMLVSIESGDANVSLNTLDRIAEALGLTFSHLVQAPSEASLSRIEALAWQGRDPASKGILLASAPAGHYVELWSLTLMPGERYASQADPSGWHEIVFVTEGVLTLELPTGERRIDAGDFHAFASDSDYAYRNDTDGPLRFVRNVVH